MANLVPFTAIKTDQAYIDGDLDVKRKMLQGWKMYNDKLAGDDQQAKADILEAANILLEQEKLGDTVGEMVGDTAIAVGLGLGGGAAGFFTPVPGGAAMGGFVGGAAAADINQRRAIEAGRRVDPYSIARTVTEGAVNAIPVVGTVGRGVMPVVKVMAKDALRVGGAGALGNVAEQLETKGEVNPSEAAMAGLTYGVGAGALRGVFEGVAKPMSRSARRAMSPEALAELEAEMVKRFTKDGAANPEVRAANEFTNEELGRLAAYRDNQAKVLAARNAAIEAQRVKVASDKAMSEAEMDEWIKNATETEFVPSSKSVNQAELSANIFEEANKPKPAGESASVLQGSPFFTKEEQLAGITQRKLNDIVSADETIEGPLQMAKKQADAETIEATLEADNLAPRYTGSETLGGLGDIPDIQGVVTPIDNLIAGNVAQKNNAAGVFNQNVVAEIERFKALGIPINEQTRKAAVAIATAGTNQERGLLRQGVNKAYGIGVGSPVPKAKATTRLTSLDQLEPIAPEPVSPMAPPPVVSLATQADNAVGAGGLGAVNAKANEIAGASPVGKQGPLGEQVADPLDLESSGLTVVSTQGDHYVEDANGNTLDVFASKEDAMEMPVVADEVVPAETPLPPRTTARQERLNKGTSQAQKAADDFSKMVDNFEGDMMQPDATKGQAKKWAKKFFDRGVINERTLEEVEIMAKDRDMGAEDIASVFKYELEKHRALLNKKAGGEGGASAAPLGIIGGGKLPSAGEPVLGALAGFGATEQREGESDEDFSQRRLENALLGMGVASLGASGVKRLAARLGQEQAGMDLEKLGAAVQATVKQKPKTREELIAEVVKLNQVIRQANAGTPQAGMSAPVFAATKAGASPKFDPAAKAKEIDAMNEAQRKGAEKTIKQKWNEQVRYVERKLITANEFIYRLAKQAEEKAGRLLDPVMDPRIITPTRGMNSAPAAWAHIQREGLDVFYTKTLNEGAKKLGMEPDMFLSQLDKYLLSKQALARYAVGATEEQVGGGFTRDVATDFVAKLGKEFEPYARVINDGYKKLLMQQVEDGLVSKELGDLLMDAFPDYVPFARIFNMDEIAEGMSSVIQSGTSTASIANQTLVRKFVGSERGIESPVGELLERVYATYEQGGRNHTARTWISMGDSDLLGPASGIKQLWRTDSTGRPLRAKGIFEKTGDGFRMLDANGKPVVDEFGEEVVVGRGNVRETDQGNWVGDGRIIKDKEAADKAKYKISYLYQGERLDAEVPKEMEEAAKGLNVPAMGLFAKMLNLPVRVGRVGFTSANPVFAFRQIPRDLQQIVANTQDYRDLPKVLVNYAKGFKAALASRIPEYAKATGQQVDSELVKRWNEYSGAFNFTEMFRDQGESKKTVSRLMGNISLMERPMQALRRIEDAISAFEDAGRLAVFKTEVDKLAEPAIAQGLIKRSDKGYLTGDKYTLDNIFYKAAQESQERTANYLNRGEWGRALNGIFLYLNAGIQGTRANVKAFKANPAMYAMKTAIFGGSSLGLITAYNMATPERAAAYMDLTEDERERNLIVLHPMALKDEKGNYLAIKIPLAQGISGLMQTQRRIVEDLKGFSLQEGKPEIFTGALEDIFGFVTPIQPDANKLMSFATPQAVRPLLESSSLVNKNFFSGQDVVPRRLEKLPPEDQFDASTPLVMRELGVALGMSPKKMEYLVKNYTGTLGTTSMYLLDKAFEAGSEKESPTRSIGEDVMNAFTKSRGGEQLNRFYALKDDADKAYNGVKAALARGDEARAREIIEDRRDDLRNHQVLAGINQQISEIYRAMRLLESRVDTNPEFRDDIAKARSIITELARNGVSMVREMDQREE